MKKTMTAIGKRDVKAVRHLIKQSTEPPPFIGMRYKRNVSGPAPKFSRREFWHGLMMCLLTTQQRSTNGSPVDRFLRARPFPLSLDSCMRARSVRRLSLNTIEGFGGIRFGPKISKYAAKDLRLLRSGLWNEVEAWFGCLRQQRLRKPRKQDYVREREAARWAAKAFVGIGPKQSRNLWQCLGLTRYEIPLDSRITNWVNINLGIKIDARRLGQGKYYESALDSVQMLCERAEVLPTTFDAAAFDY